MLKGHKLSPGRARFGKADSLEFKIAVVLCCLLPRSTYHDLLVTSMPYFVDVGGRSRRRTDVDDGKFLLQVFLALSLSSQFPRSDACRP
jgi:hypothetical protein